MNEIANEWALWLQKRLDERGWRQADLVRASDGNIKRDRVSKWLHAKEKPSYALAIIVANSLDVPKIDALHAAGFHDYLDGQNGEPIQDKMTRNISRALSDIEARLPRKAMLERLTQYTDSELLYELMRRNTERHEVSK